MPPLRVAAVEFDCEKQEARRRRNKNGRGRRGCAKGWERRKGVGMSEEVGASDGQAIQNTMFQWEHYRACQITYPRNFSSSLPQACLGVRRDVPMGTFGALPSKNSPSQTRTNQTRIKMTDRRVGFLALSSALCSRRLLSSMFPRKRRPWLYAHFCS